MEKYEFLRGHLTFVSFFGDKEFIIALFLFFGVIYLVYNKYLKEAFFLLLSSLSYPISLYLKLLFKHDRPHTSFLKTSIIDIYSFPSSHVLVYTTVFGYVLYLTFKIKKMDKLLKFTLRILSLYLIILVGASRVFLGEHWIKDIIFGYLIGLILLIFIIFLEKSMVFRTNFKTKKSK